MAETDIDAVIRSTGKKQHKTVMEAARKRHARLMALAAKAKDKAEGSLEKHRQEHACHGQCGGEAAADHGGECRRQLRAIHEKGDRGNQASG